MKQARLKFDYKEENKSSEKTIKKPFNQDIKWRKGIEIKTWQHGKPL